MSGTAVAMLALGLASFVMLWASHRIADGHVQEDAPLDGAVSDLRVAVATSHLWLEEHLSGDDIDMELDVWGQLDRASALAGALLEGGEGIEAPLEERRMRSAAERTRKLLGDFREVAEERVASEEDAGAGSRLDIEYDRIFADLLATTRGLNELIDERMRANQRRSDYLFVGILVFWGGVVLLFLSGLVRRERMRRRAEAALREKEAQLRQAQKLEAVGRLAGGVAHDINNYLAAIATQCELIKILYPDDARLREKMDEALDVIARTTSLLRRLLAFSRSRPSLREVVSLNCVASSMSAMLRRLLGADVELELAVEPEPWNVEIDPSQLEQVLVNLLVNARDAMPGGGRVRVGTENVVVREGEALPGRGALEVEPGEHALLSVADSGPGIPEEALDQIFEPFYTTKDTSDRSGLGLATVYGIVRQNGGALRVDSRLGEGTTFYIYLPRTRRPATTEARRRADGPQSYGDGRRLLLAEDNLDVAGSLTAMLTALGHEVVHEESGQAALERFEERPGRFELVISDIVMPGMNGGELAERLWAFEPDLPVLFISGYTDRVVLDDLVAGRRADFLAKPFTAADLTAKIAGVMAREVGEEAS